MSEAKSPDKPTEQKTKVVDQKAADGDKAKTKLTFVLQEIISTEKSFLTSIQVVCDAFAQAHLGPLTMEERIKMEIFLAPYKKILKNAQKNPCPEGKNEEQIQAWMQAIDSRPFAQGVAQYDEFLAFSTELKSKGKINGIPKEVKNPNSLTIDSHMVTLVQRWPRYVLFAPEIVKATTAKSEEEAALQADPTLKYLKTQALEINETTAAASRLLSNQSRCYNVQRRMSSLSEEALTEACKQRLLYLIGSEKGDGKKHSAPENDRNAVRDLLQSALQNKVIYSREELYDIANQYWQQLQDPTKQNYLKEALSQVQTESRVFFTPQPNNKIEKKSDQQTKYKWDKIGTMLQAVNSLQKSKQDQKSALNKQDSKQDNLFGLCERNIDSKENEKIVQCCCQVFYENDLVAVSKLRELTSSSTPRLLEHNAPKSATRAYHNNENLRNLISATLAYVRERFPQDQVLVDRMYELSDDRPRPGSASALQAELKQATAELEAKNLQIARLEAELKQVKTELEQTKAELKPKEDQITHLSEGLEQARKDSQEIQARLMQLDQQHQSLIAKMKVSQQQLQENIRTHQEEAKKHEMQLQEKSKQIEALEAKQAEATQTIEKQKSEIKTQGETIKHLEERVQDLEAIDGEAWTLLREEAAPLSKDQPDTADEKAPTALKKETLPQKIEALKAKVTTLKAQLAEAQRAKEQKAKAVSADVEIDDLRAKPDLKEPEQNKLNQAQQLKANEETTAKTAAELNQKTAQIAQLEEVQRQKDQEIAQLKQQLRAEKIALEGKASSSKAVSSEPQHRPAPPQPGADADANANAKSKQQLISSLNKQLACGVVLVCGGIAVSAAGGIKLGGAAIPKMEMDATTAVLLAAAGALVALTGVAVAYTAHQGKKNSSLRFM